MANGPTNQLVTWLNDPAAQDPAIAGGKGSALARMTEKGMPVPDGFVVTSGAFLMSASFQLLQALTPILRASATDTDAIGEASEHAMAAIASSPINPMLIDAISEAYKTMGGDAVSVRSSATAEDMADASFAGQYDSFLNILTFDDMVQGVRDVWASLYSTRAIAYRIQSGVPNSSVGMAVVVQRQIHPDASGVMFTRDPVTGANRFVVSAALGLGEGVVAGEAPADRVELDPNTGAAIKTEVVSKDAMVAALPEGSTSRVDVPEWRRLQPALGERSLVRLSELARQLEAMFGGPQDIEFAVVDEKVHLLQSRPITTLDDVEPTDATEWDGWVDPKFSWAQSFLGVFAGPVYQLQLDVADAFSDGMRQCFEETGAERTRNHIMTLVNDFVYVRVPEIDADVLAGRVGRHVARCQAFIDQGTSNYDEEIAPQVEAELAKLKQFRAAGRSLSARQAYLKASIDAAGFVMGHLHWCMSGMTNRLDWPSAFHEITGEPIEDNDAFLHAVPNMTTRLVTQLRNLAKIVQTDPPLAAAFARDQFEALDAPANKDRPVAKQFSKHFAKLIREFGFRTGWGFGSNVDFEATTWRMEPRKPLQLIASYAEQDIGDMERLEKAALRRRQQATRRIRRKLAGDPARLERFETTRVRAQSDLRRMENHNYLMEQSTVGQMRDAMHEMGLALVETGVIDQPLDVLHVRLEELREIAEGHGPEDLRALVAERSERRARFSMVTPPPTLGKPVVGGPTPATVDVPALEDEGVIRGMAASRGRASGPARLVEDAASAPRLHTGDVLIARNVGPDWTPFFPLLSAIVLDEGEIFQHPAIVAREYRIPAVFKTQSATRRIREGQMVTVNGNDGTVELGE